MAEVTIGKLLLDDAIPEQYRTAGPLDGKRVSALLNAIAESGDSDTYARVSEALVDIGREAAYRGNPSAFTPGHLRTSSAAHVSRARLKRQTRKILRDPRLSREQKREAVIKAAQAEQDWLRDKVIEEARKAGNPLARDIDIGARGKPGQLQSLIAGGELFTDAKGRIIPIPVTRSLAEGRSLAQYWAGTYGGRTGLIGTKLSVADGGYLNKRLIAAAHRLMSVGEDDEEAADPDRGLPVDAEDDESVGALLARETAGHPRNTVLTPKVLEDIRNKGVKRLLIRSPLVGGPESGLYSRDIGVRETGTLPAPGENVGNPAVQAIAEKLTQGSLCLAQGTMVRMADGSEKPIELIEPGEWVLGSDMERTTFPVQVLTRFDNGDRECHRTVFSPAYDEVNTVEVISTLDHKILSSRCVSGQLDEKLNYQPRLLPIGTKSRNFFAHPPERRAEGSGTVREPFSKLLGLLSGDGCYTRSVNGVHLSCYDPSLIEDFKDELATLNLKASKLKGHEGYYRISQIREAKAARDADTGRVLSGARNPAIIALESRGMMHKYAHEKELPPDIGEWCDDSVLDYLAGLFSADGSWYVAPNGGTHFALGMTALPVVEGVKSILADRFCVYASGEIKKTTTQGKQGLRKHPMHTLLISQSDQVKKLTELVGPRLIGVKRQSSAPALTHQLKRSSPYRFIRRSQVAVGVLPTYDLEVDHPDHLFVLANGLIVSNSSKHGGGVLGAGPQGLALANQLIEHPKNFPVGAAHAELDGRVQEIREAPQGGWYIKVDGQDHYADVGLDPLVKVGDQVEAGDVLSKGIPNPETVIQHKGIGAGAAAFTRQFHKALRDSGIKAERRNVELVVRGLVDHVQMTEDDGEHVPGDIVSYKKLENRWKPRESARPRRPGSALGQYLEKPVLHYTIGTQVKPSIVRDLEEFGVQEILASPEPMPFKPVMIRASAIPQYDEDFMTRMLGGHQEKSLLGALHRTGFSDTASTSFVPALAQGQGFGDQWPKNVIKK